MGMQSLRFHVTQPRADPTLRLQSTSSFLLLSLPQHSVRQLAHPRRDRLCVMILRLLQSLVLSMCKFYIGIWLFLYVAPKLIRLLERPEQAPDVTLPEGHPGHARQCYNRAVGLLQRAGTVRDPQMADEMVAMARKALIFCPNNDNDRRNRCWILSSALFVSSVISDDDRLLHESIERAREAWALSPRGHPERARACANLAKPLNHLYKHTGSEDLWNEAVDLQREALSLYPVRLWRRWIYDYLTRRPSQLALCQDLATSLATRYKRTSDEWCLDEAIALRRKMLSRCPAWYPERAKACSALAKLLAMRYKGGDNERLLDELISLQREAFDLRRPQGDWADIGAELAEFLWIRFEISGADTILDEIIDIQRSVLALRPRGHKSRGSHCVNLGRSLSIYYERNGDGRFLDEAIDLLREAHPLCSLQAPSRWIYAERLAHSLFLRYRTTRADELLKEAIHLQREAYDICPVGPTTYVNRASMLWNLYIFTHDDSLLDEINLLREAVNLCPVRHRPQLCEIVAHSYMKRYESNGDGALLSDIFHFAHEAKAVAPMHRVWRSCCRLSWVHGRRTSTVFYDLGQAIQYLSESLQHEPDDIPYLVTNIVNRVGHLWDHDVGHKQTELTAVYQRLVNLLPLVANSTLVIQPQRRAFERFKNVGSDAFVSATLAGNSKLGLEMLEVAQGAVWSQTLRYRDPQLQRIPEPARSELKGLLNAIGERTSRGDPGSTDGHDTTLTPRDGLLKESPRAYAAIAKIRALPGFDRFMLGETYESLCMAASTHPVVVLVGARGYFYALVISPSQAHEHALLSLHLTDEEMKTISFTPSVEAQQGTGEYVPEESLHRQLEVLWFKVVKPVLDHLDIKASERCIGIT
jgi:tetratricopeptide (TPR) repeat protein